MVEGEVLATLSGAARDLAYAIDCIKYGNATTAAGSVRKGMCAVEEVLNVNDPDVGSVASHLRKALASAELVAKSLDPR